MKKLVYVVLVLCLFIKVIDLFKSFIKGLIFKRLVVEIFIVFWYIINFVIVSKKIVSIFLFFCKDLKFVFKLMVIKKVSIKGFFKEELNCKLKL